ncbi:hypothetical protein TRV_04056 [Trichophyton verrucosum HKI 0517]|uniref:Uncharacterized protein n=1 Tax=Trichophyton verrucosum (strain HKI 0517) TaxID=663202 RepID=D4DAA9_TRIVH|nr:uncharacterized protein TRV_04056 [Trichophyton verrucosum HKI 0517]EFE41260.1 hypothetical protein TRV_04056 [Trichophyton verrucosum HKI 0517]
MHPFLRPIHTYTPLPPNSHFIVKKHLHDKKKTHIGKKPLRHIQHRKGEANEKPKWKKEGRKVKSTNGQNIILPFPRFIIPSFPPSLFFIPDPILFPRPLLSTPYLLLLLTTY